MNAVAVRPGVPRLAAPGPRAILEAGTAFELVASTLTVADTGGRDRFADVAQWRERARAMDGTDRRILERMGPHVVMNLVGLAAESGGERSAADFLRHAAAISPVELIRNAVGRYRRDILRTAPGDLIDDAIAGDKAAQKQFLAMSWPDVPEWHRSLRFVLGRPPEELAPAIVRAFRAWHDRVFATEAERLGRAQLDQVAALSAESAVWRPDALLRRVAPGADYVPPAGVDLLTFVPVSSVRPVVIFLDHRMETFVLFPVVEASIGDAPPEQLVQLGKALGDELRLRALRALAAGPRTLADLATELGVPRTSLAHHVSILRAAGLLTHTIDDGRWGRLELRASAVGEIPPLFRRYIGG